MFIAIKIFLFDICNEKCMSTRHVEVKHATYCHKILVLNKGDDVKTIILFYNYNFGLSEKVL